MRTVAAICRELTADRRTDGELLAAFISARSEESFLELVRRHGPLVWGACRRLLPDPADAEDAFQAAFLVLVRRSHRLTKSDAVGPWLHRVAVWTARNVRRKNARRLARQQPLPEHVPGVAPNADLRADIDAALLALPARYRESIILCHLQGFSRREAAERLGCAEGTLSAWLNRGLAKLRDRLSDLDPAKALGVGAVAVPAALAANTARAAVAFSAAVASVPPAVSSLVEGVLHMLWIKKATAATFALCAVFVMGVGVGFGTRTEHTGAVAQEKGAPKVEAVPNRAKEIAQLEEAVRVKETILKALDTARLELKPTVLVGGPAADEYARLREQAARTEAELKVLKGKLAELKAPADRAKEIEEAEVAVTQLKLQQIMNAARLQDAKDRLAKLKEEKAANANNGHLELTIGGKAGAPEFVIREVPPPAHGFDREPLGPLTTRDPAMLAKLLARAKLDPNGPQEVRVVVQPQAALSQAPLAALEACDAAGYKTVKFTGYVFGGGFAVELKADQTGEVRGYKRYDNTEVKPKELAEEIKEGLRRL